MTHSTPQSGDRTALPEMARRLMAILGRLAGVVGTGFLRGTRFEGVVGLVWQRLMSVARRFRRAGLSRPRPSRAGQVRAGQGQVPGRSKPEIRLPCQKGWLIKELGYRATPYAAQLSDLLDEPEMRAVIDAIPLTGRVLRPICWMLGISRIKATSAAELAARAARRAAKRASPEAMPVRAMPVRAMPVRAMPVRRQPAGGGPRPASASWQAPPPQAPHPPPEIAWNYAKSR